MTRHVLTVDLRDDPTAIAAYVAHHRRVWPEVLGSLRRAGVREMTIYLLDRRLVMVVEIDGADVRQAFAQHMAAGPRVTEWETLMRALIQPPPGSVPGEWWTVMEPIFRLEQQNPSPAAPGALR
jgi:L-rhamnose mutarotase